jgi:hypothetical protein
LNKVREHWTKEERIMAFTVKVGIKKDIFTAESSDVLSEVKKKTEVKAFVQVKPYQIHTEINLTAAALSIDKKTSATKAAQKEADTFQGELEDKIEKLVKRLKELQAKDKMGDAKAGEEAEKECKKCGDEIDDTLPDFGIRIRKAVEKGSGAKLAAGCKSLSNGRFGGDPKIKLVAEFDHAGASSEVAKDYRDAVKSFEKAKAMIAEEVKGDKKTADALKASVKKTLQDASDVNPVKDPAGANKLIAGVPGTAESFAKSFDLYAKNVNDFGELLRKTREGFNKESNELKKDLTTPESREKKTKLDKVGDQLLDLQSAVTKRLMEAKQIAQQFREAEKISLPANAKEAERVKVVKDWQAQIAGINAQVAKFDEIDADKFNKALQEMATESKKPT